MITVIYKLVKHTIYMTTRNKQSRGFLGFPLFNLKYRNTHAGTLDFVPSRKLEDKNSFTNFALTIGAPIRALSILYLLVNSKTKSERLDSN